MKHSFTAFLWITLLLVGCKPLVVPDATEANTPSAEVTAEEAMDGESLGMPTDHVLKGAIVNGYRYFEEGVIRNGRTKVLFFHAHWCPYCKEKDENLREWYEAEQIPLNTYQVDYDSSMNLRQQFNVAQQDTFVVVDGDGAALATLTSPSLSDLKRVLYGNMDRAQQSEPANFAGSSSRAAQEPQPTQVFVASGEFMAYREGVIGNGEPAVLFFHAQWCPYCIANEKRLNDWYGANDYDVSTYKIDFDSALELKKQFGVTQQDTFIRIDGSGQEVTRVSFPSEDALQQLIQ